MNLQLQSNDILNLLISSLRLPLPQDTQKLDSYAARRGRHVMVDNVTVLPPEKNASAIHMVAQVQRVWLPANTSMENTAPQFRSDLSSDMRQGQTTLSYWDFAMS
jgi:hypothetical protein